MAQFPCPDKPCCPPEEAPLIGTSSEAPDFLTFIGRAWGNFLNLPLSDCQVWPCYETAESFINQDDADAQARVKVAICQFGENAFFNTEQTCQSDCADGSTFRVTVPAGYYGAKNQLLADRVAFTVACRLMDLYKICLSASGDTSICLGSDISLSLDATTRAGELRFQIISGALPPGVEFLQNSLKTAVIFGTPTESGLFTFTVRCSNTHFGYIDHEFNVAVGQIIDDSPLPDGETATAYSYMLTVLGMAGATSWAVTAGTLPSGLTLNGITGEISGLPDTEETQVFTVTASSGSTSCSKQFSINVTQSAIPPGPWSIILIPEDAVAPLPGVQDVLMTSADTIYCVRNNDLRSSTDGHNYTSLSTIGGAFEFIAAFTYGSGLFMAAGDAAIGDGFAYTSPDGLAWTTYVPGTVFSNVRSSAYGNGAWCIATDTKLHYSTNLGLGWAFIDFTGVYGVTLAQIVFANGIFVLVSDTGGIFTSPDGAIWTQQVTPSVSSVVSVAWASSKWIAITSQTVWISPDSVNWVEHTPALSLQQRWIAGGNGLFTLIDFFGFVWDSADGITWNPHGQPSPLVRHFAQVECVTNNVFAVREYNF